MATLKDGLGGEEVGPSGLEWSGTAVMSAYYVGSITAVDQISGANIYSTADVIGESVYGDTVVSGVTVKGTTLRGTVVSGVTFSGGTIHQASRGKIESIITSSGTSTTLRYGNLLQAGSGTLSSNGVWVPFGRNFTGSPIVTVTNLTFQSGLVVPVGSIGPGSFYCSGQTASDEFSWMAVGPV